MFRFDNADAHVIAYMHEIDRRVTQWQRNRDRAIIMRRRDAMQSRHMMR